MERPKLLASGCNDQGQLGNGTILEVEGPGASEVGAVSESPSVVHWRQVSTGGCHSAGVAGDGECFTWGLADRGQLGHGDDVTNKPVPERVKALDGQFIDGVACGFEHTVAFSNKKGLYAWGSNEFGQTGAGKEGELEISKPRLVTGLSSVHVLQVACGFYHTLCITASVEVYAWGQGSRGQLGLGDFSGKPSPALLQSLWCTPVVQVAAGETHSAALTATGHLFTWGSGKYGQLGLPEGHMTSIPISHPEQSMEAEPLSRDAPMDDVGMPDERNPGAHARMADPRLVHLLLGLGISREAAEFACAATGNASPELAVEFIYSHPGMAERAAAAPAPQQPPRESREELWRSQRVALVPTRVPSVAQAVRVATGANHTVLCTRDGRVVSFGEGGRGQLGHGEAQPERTPRVVAALLERGVRAVAAGREHSLYLTEDGRVFGSGSNEWGDSSLFLAGGARLPPRAEGARLSQLQGALARAREGSVAALTQQVGEIFASAT
eukprot:gene27196-33478_t